MAEDAVGALRKRVKELERQVAESARERDDLTRDLESLLLQSAANTTFTTSSVLQERIYFTGGLV